MTEDDPREPASDPRDETLEPAETAETEWKRRRRLAAVFGDVLPDTTSDERDAEAPRDDEDGDATERWLRSQVPPHHG